MEILEGFEVVGLLKDGEVVADEFPIEWLPGAAGVLDELVYVAPVAGGARRVVTSSLNFEADEVLGVDDGNGAVGCKGQAFGPLQHAKSGGAEGV